MEIFQLFFCVSKDVYSHLNAIMLRATRIDLPLLVKVIVFYLQYLESVFKLGISKIYFNLQI